MQACCIVYRAASLVLRSLEYIIVTEVTIIDSIVAMSHLK